MVGVVSLLHDILSFGRVCDAFYLTVSDLLLHPFNGLVVYILVFGHLNGHGAIVFAYIAKGTISAILEARVYRLSSILEILRLDPLAMYDAVRPVLCVVIAKNAGVFPVQLVM